MKKAIIIGASSGIGKELAKILAEQNYVLGLAARRDELLFQLQKELNADSYVRHMNISKLNKAMKELSELITEMDGVDLIIITSGTGYINHNLEWDKEKETIDVNVSGVTAMINISLKHFIKKNAGQLAVISSVASLRGSREAPAYNASKAFISNYLEGIRCMIKKNKLNIAITDIRPGLVDTKMAKGDGLFWVQPVEKAVRQIYNHIKRRKDVAYVTKRWGVIGLFMKLVPNWIYNRF